MDSIADRPEPSKEQIEIRREVERLLGLLIHASIHLERKNMGAVAEALADAMKRASSLLDELKRRS